MNNIVKATVSILTAAFLITLSFVANTVAAAILVPIYFMCALVFYCFELCLALTKSSIDWLRDSIGVAHNKEVAFRIEPDSPNGIKLGDIASGRCNEYNGVNLRDLLRYAYYHKATGKYIFPSSAEPVILVSGSNQHFLGRGDTVYPVQPLMSKPASLFPPRRKTSPLSYTWMQDPNYGLVDERDAVREIVLKTNFVVTGPRTNDVVRFQCNSIAGSDISRVKLITPSVVMSKTKDMTPMRLALLSPHILPDDSESVFFRRYVALARARMHYNGGDIPWELEWDIRANGRQFSRVLVYNRVTLSRMNAGFLRGNAEFIFKNTATRPFECDAARVERHSRDMLILLGLSHSGEAIFKPITKQSRFWLVSEFMHSRQFQDAVVSAAMASVTNSIDRGLTSKAAILKAMPYLCKQIPGLCEAVYTIIRAAKYNNGVCEEGELDALALYSVSNVLRGRDKDCALDLPGVDEEHAFEGMSDREIERFDALKDSALRASHVLHGDNNNVDDMYKTGRRVLRDENCSAIIAYLVAHNVRSNGMHAGGGVFHLHTHDISDTLIVDYIRADSVLRDHAFENGAKLEFADRQELEMHPDARVETRVFREIAYPPASGTLLDNTRVTAVGAESRAPGPVPGAASA
ncbi:hypothetical protein F0Q53_00095 [Anaplasma marginale]|uniref:Uncharacterized protein n=1 Tax=Anaplasma marginale TaxID=770 RepID=A0A643CN09_ANAMA|nr:hypothetical protein [Anaplasma marginale]AXW84008.1 hypothetical protein CQZ76_02090 [Anaplasma marginale]KAA8475210.1 hypothetical protein F0Q53_00095 [Anaplasma marginale]KAB0452783.1 hypothetical protein FY207_00095 [Anaplasma marginale]